MFNKVETLYSQAENIDTKEAYQERDRLYKEMTFEEILNIIGEVKELTSLMTTNLHEFNLDVNEVSAVASEINFLKEIGECLTTITKLKRIRGDGNIVE